MKIWICLAATLASGCSATNWRHTCPWNFPSSREWNQPLELSWVNAVDKFREITTPRGRVYDPLTKTTAPDFGAALKELDPSSLDRPGLISE